jgi:uncharacterized protein (UPF0264 family)
LAALAGSLAKQDIQQVCSLGADIIGVRGAVCTKNDRAGKLEITKVAELAEEIKKTKQ